MTRTMRMTAPTAARIYRTYYRTLRLEAIGPDGSRRNLRDCAFDNEILAVCERVVLLVTGMAAERDMHVLIADGRDGDWVAAIAAELGLSVVRGSSRHRPATAFRGLAARARDRRPMLIVVDGPLGPAGVAKAGAIALASAFERPVRALGCAASPAIPVRGTWSGMYVPLPFARGSIAIAEPWHVRDATARETRERCAAALSATLQRQREHALVAVR
jgi:lysophospholipid acyltransferase (LPLAT)-like uncharacterized protein